MGALGRATRTPLVLGVLNINCCSRLFLQAADALVFFFGILLFTGAGGTLNTLVTMNFLLGTVDRRDGFFNLRSGTAGILKIARVSNLFMIG